MPKSPKLAARAKLAGLTARRQPGDPAIAQARADLAEERLREAILREVQAEPPLSDEVRAKLAVILGGGDHDGTT